MNFLPVEIIKKKRDGHELSPDEIEFFIQNYTIGKIPDYQMSALLMAILLKDMTKNERLSLTKSMLFSGQTVDFSKVKKFKVDKHSTGGIGDKTSLILAPIVAACGIHVPMISGRGLGHTGGTLDKLESIPGFRTNLTLAKFETMVQNHGLCFIGQTNEICPADRKIYALRDVTGTVESLPLICASIMSKKLAEGIDGLVLDVKVGNGAFMKSLEEAESLSEGLISIAQMYNKKVRVLLTDMNQPLGRFAGNGHEVFECLAILNNETHIGPSGSDLYGDTRNLSLHLAAEMIQLSEASYTYEKCYELAKEALESGRALSKFSEICTAQGGNLQGFAEKFKEESKSFVVRASIEGFITEFRTESIGIAGILLGAGRVRAEDSVDPFSGIEFHYKIGDFVKPDSPIFTVHAKDEVKILKACDLLKDTFTISLKKPEKPSLIVKRI